MSRLHPGKTGTSLLMALGIIASGIAPILTTTATAAPLFPQQTNTNQQPTSNYVTIPYGTVVPVMYDKGEKIVVSPTETLPLSLKVAANISDRNGNVLIPYGSEVVGQVQPVEGGSQFVAKELIIDGYRRQYLDATSNVISQTQEVSQGSNTGSILQGALVGAGAAAAISLITGNRSIELLEILGGAGLGAAGGLVLGNGNKTQVVVINPNTDLSLTLRSNLALR